MAVDTPSSYPIDVAVAPTCIDLFCGAGGLTLGFTQAGGVPLAAVDFDADSMATYRSMFPMCADTHHGDIQEWDPQLSDRPIDVVIGGPPCQGFSLARGLRFVDDPRNHLYKHFVRLVEKFQPKWFVMENVPGITNLGGGVILTQIYEDFQAVGYRLDHRVVNMADYGVPQTRKRAIFVGRRGLDAQPFVWPKPTHAPISKLSGALLDERVPYTSVGDALSDLPWPLGRYFSHRANSQMRGPRNRAVATEPSFTLRVRGDEFALCEEPATGAFIPGPLSDVDLSYGPIQAPYQIYLREPPPHWVQSYDAPPQRVESVPALTGTRRLHVREQARLQSFPDWFTFLGRPYSQARQVGNAVPPLFARQLFEAILTQSAEAEDVQCGVSRLEEGCLKNAEVLV